MLGLGDLKQTKFYQEAFAEGEEIGCSDLSMGNFSYKMMMKTNST